MIGIGVGIGIAIEAAFLSSPWRRAVSIPSTNGLLDVMPTAKSIPIPTPAPRCDHA